MKIGILSDTHGRTEPMKKAIALLQQKGAEFFIHCGDVGGTAVLDYLVGQKAAFVFGNTDFDRSEMQKHAELMGLICLNNGGELELDGVKIAVTHGDDPSRLHRILTEQSVRYLFVGHTHQQADVRQGTVRVINPGALHRVSRKSVAMLDTQSDFLEWFFIDD